MSKTTLPETRDQFRERIYNVYMNPPDGSHIDALEAVYAQALRDVIEEVIPYVIGITTIDTELMAEWAEERGIDLEAS
jgi:hypothetical protein